MNTATIGIGVQGAVQAQVNIFMNFRVLLTIAC